MRPKKQKCNHECKFGHYAKSWDKKCERGCTNQRWIQLNPKDLERAYGLFLGEYFPQLEWMYKDPYAMQVDCQVKKRAK